MVVVSILEDVTVGYEAHIIPVHEHPRDWAMVYRFASERSSSINLLTPEIFQEATWLSFPLQPGSEGGMERAGNTKLIFKVGTTGRCRSISSASIWLHALTSSHQPHIEYSTAIHRQWRVEAAALYRDRIAAQDGHNNKYTIASIRGASSGM